MEKVLNALKFEVSEVFDCAGGAIYYKNDGAKRL